MTSMHANDSLHRWSAHIGAMRAAIALRIDTPAPRDVDRHARLIVLDTLGCALAGRVAPEVEALETYAASLEAGSISLPGGPGLGLRNASQILAIGPTWHEACEGHPFSHGRPGIATFAALLPLALARDATLGEFIDAFVLGYEVSARAGGWLRLVPGLHVDGNWPALGVAAGVGRLMGASVDQAMTAVDIAACQLPSSLYLPIRTGCSVRNGYLAHSASLGLDAAFASLAGFDAPADALAWYAEHLSRASTELPDPAANLILDGYLKPFAAVRHVHYGALAARRLRERLGIDAPGRIASIRLSIYEEATIYCNNPQPRTPLAAQFSLSFGLASMLRFGELDAASYESPRFEDPELRQLEARVRIDIDENLTRCQLRGATLSLKIGDDELMECVDGNDPALLLDAEGAIEKFARNASPRVEAEAGRHWARALLAAPSDARLAALWDALSPRTRPRSPA